MLFHPEHLANRARYGVASFFAQPPAGHVKVVKRSGSLLRKSNAHIASCLLLLSMPTSTLAGLVLTTEARALIEHNRFIDLRRDRFSKRESPYNSPARAQVILEHPAPWKVTKNAWRHQITATVFWVGEQPSARNPTPNTASSWDPMWQENFGGMDHPVHRDQYSPAGFTPRMNPFYIALPYNDLTPTGAHRPEAPDVIPWFWDAYRGGSISVCEDRWVAIHHRGRVCFAQWKDTGPFRTDDWEYVFQGKRPKPNPNQNAGIDLSPAVRDFLGVQGTSKVDWRFVEEHEIRQGPWARWVRDTPPDGS